MFFLICLNNRDRKNAECRYFYCPSKAYNTSVLQNYPDTLKIFLFQHKTNACHISISRQNKNHNPLIRLWLKN